MATQWLKLFSSLLYSNWTAITNVLEPPPDCPWPIDVLEYFPDSVPLVSIFKYTKEICVINVHVRWFLIEIWCSYKNVLRPLFSCDQAALQMLFSVCPSVRLSVRLSVTPFWLCSHHSIIMKFSGVITNDQSKVHAKGQGQRSKVKVTEFTTQLNRFRTVTPVWIHIWWWNDAYSLMLLRRGALLFFKVIRQISRSHSSKNGRMWPRLGVSGL